MSLDVYLLEKPKRVICVCSDCNNRHYKKKSECFYDSNITHNLGEMANKAGVYYALWRPEERGWKKAKDIIPVLEKGLKKLVSNPEKFKSFNPDNGWGDYQGLVSFVENYLEACKSHPNSEIKVSR